MPNLRCPSWAAEAAAAAGHLAVSTCMRELLGGKEAMIDQLFFHWLDSCVRAADFGNRLDFLDIMDSKYSLLPVVKLRFCSILAWAHSDYTTDL